MDDDLKDMQQRMGQLQDSQFRLLMREEGGGSFDEGEEGMHVESH